MSTDLVTVLFLIGFTGSLLSGMLGIGGSIIKYPMLLYIPALIGAASYTAQEVSALAMVQVLFATLAGVFAYKKSNLIHRRLVLDMGISIVIGSLLGGYGSKFLPDDLINVIYGLLAAIAAVMMFLPDRGKNRGIADTMGTTDIQYNRLIAIISSFIVGLLSGIVGAGGAFILIPIMISILHIPTRVTIASSLAIVFLSSIGGTLGKVMTGQVLWGPSVLLVIGSLIGAPVGAIIGKKTNTRILQYALAVLILATAVQVWWGILE
ncbi:sulfite exporter TauE/SafE family protein [Kroppenstedtia eburnea]|uniref:Probable membrane transporter protein n=1 Tax=Kroppenstedtia eburnea TaxID=714067 RepID=A0A1N7NWE1_9BACL|nr:sulfite exporter TauE/SafE family protein [Kroppenstedtia eburnea]EGK08440.1 protein of hypothetical function DUF81 [Desmospora sp. 8437]QKI81198.1 sulfite exporter TauE/SafE family protein [Kroppenstedtia eburnea]SIT02606.1 hypothetical protein SAMN05421790_11087 [Kroppenstedtia eburnea]